MRVGFLLIFFLFVCCYNNDNSNPIERALYSDNQKIKVVTDNIDQYEVQILFTEINRDIDNKLTFTDFSFQVDDSLYFYPASSVKFPIAVLALEKMNEQKELDRNSIFYVEGDSIETTIAKEIKKIFTVSDNEAYNRLFEYLGQDEINTRLSSKGIKARISHRLSTENSDRLTTKSLIFYLNDSTSTTTSEIINKPLKKLELKRILKGEGFIKEDRLVKQPFDFSYKNYLPLTSLHNSMKRLMFPEHFSDNEIFNLSADDRDFIIQSMKTLPKEAGYTSDHYYDSYVKFLVFGDSKKPMPPHIEIYNKVGYAYGYLTDCAHIINKKTSKEYIITATIHVNNNGVFNDNTYEYENIGIPFLAELGRQLVTF